MKKKFLSTLLAFTLTMTSLPTISFAEGTMETQQPMVALTESQTTTSEAIEIKDTKYVGDGYEVEFRVVNQWPGAFQGEFVLTNTGNQALENWTLSFDLDYEITNMWNAQILTHEDDSYTIKNMGWNQDIEPGSNVTIGFQANGEGTINNPSKYGVDMERQVASNEDYTIRYKLTGHWNSGFNAEITITNQSKAPIEDWSLAFDFDANINNLWTATIVEHTGSHYVIKNNGYNANIAPGQTLTLGFSGDSLKDSTVEPIHYELSYIGKAKDKEEIDFVLDSDNDALPDYYENILGSDPLNPDTDSDGIADGYEYWELMTDLLLPDSDGNNISDADEDFDQDSLTNLQEILLGTDPFNNDTDSDWIEDGSEVNTYNTDPLIYNEFDSNTDSDNDTLYDSTEMILGSDLYNSDSDGDGLKDAYEHLTLGTDLLLQDTDSNGIFDGEEDFDNDGLTNLQEQTLNTLSNNTDSDDDGLSDGDEVNKYSTDPLKQDTDTDNLDDFREIELGTNPIAPDTDNNGTLDGEETFEVIYTVPDEEKDNNVFPTIEMNIQGEFLDTLSIKKVPEYDVSLPSEMPGYIGAGYEFELGTTFDEATLIFRFDQNLLNIDDFYPAIYYCDEENQQMVLLENQIIDFEKGTVTATITHFSKYIVLDQTEFEKAFITEDNEEINREAIYLGIGIQATEDVENTLEESKNLSIQLVEGLTSKDWIGVLSYAETTGILNGLTHNKQEFALATNSIQVLPQENKSITTGVNMTLGLVGANMAGVCSDETTQLIDIPKQYIVVFSDGQGTYNPILTQWAQYKNVVIYTVGIGNEINEHLLKDIAESTGGKYYHIKDKHLLIEEFKNRFGLNIDKEVDTDNDGLSDYYEENLILFNGIRIDLDPNDPDTDDDGLLDGEEIIYIPANNSAFSSVSRNRSTGTSFKRISDGKKKDSDHDGILDADEIPLLRSKYNTTTITQGNSFHRYIASPGDIHTFKFEPPANGPYRIYTEGSTDTYIDAYLVPNFKKTKKILMYSDNNSGVNKNAMITESFFQQVNWLSQPCGGYEFKIKHVTPMATGEYDITLNKYDKYKEAGFKAGDLVLEYAYVNTAKGIKEFPFLLELQKGPGGYLVPQFQSIEDAEKFANLNSVYISGKQWLSFIVGFTPADVPKDLYDFIKGKDTITGEEINRWLLAACIITPEIMDQGVKLYGKNADEISGLVKNGGELVELSKTSIKHILNNHSFAKIQPTIDVLMSKGLRDSAEKFLKKKTLFNPNWSQEKIIEAAEIAYNSALKAGLESGKHTVDVFGEKITVVFNEGHLDTIFGPHKLTLSDFGYK